MEKENAIEYITRADWRKSSLGLGRITQLMRLLGNPQDKLKFIHVAGTNGKSSTTAMLAGVLAQAGYTAGLYTSPYVNQFNERMQVNGKPIPDNELAEVTEYVRGHADAMEDHPTEFELVTAIALEWFYRRRCDVVALEVGLGGRLDATNVIGTPELAVITTIGLDHTAELGDTLPQIAAEKAGIIKPGGDVVLYPQPPEVEAVFQQACAGVGARLTHVDFAPLVPGSARLTGQTFSYGPLKDLSIPLLGAHQLRNAATALTALARLREKGWKIPESAVRTGLANCRWPARFEVMRTDSAFILDGGHNPEGAAALVAGLEQFFPGEKVYFLVGVMADKDYGAMFELLRPCAAGVFCVAPDNPRALPADDLAAFLKQAGWPAPQPCGNVQSGIESALAAAGKDGVACAFGSLYMAGEIRRYFGF